MIGKQRKRIIPIISNLSAGWLISIGLFVFTRSLIDWGVANFLIAFFSWLISIVIIIFGQLIYYFYFFVEIQTEFIEKINSKKW